MNALSPRLTDCSWGRSVNSNQSINQTSQWEWWSPIETVLTNINRLKRGKIVQFKWMIIRECIITNPNGFEFRTTHNSTNTIRSLINAIIPDIIICFGICETLLSNHHTLQFNQSIQFKQSHLSKTIISYHNPFQPIDFPQSQLCSAHLIVLTVSNNPFCSRWGDHNMSFILGWTPFHYLNDWWYCGCIKWSFLLP